MSLLIQQHWRRPPAALGHLLRSDKLISVIQRVTYAEVLVAHKSVAKIGRGILALVAVEKNDAEIQAERLANRILKYRIFPDAGQRMNLSVLQVCGAILAVPQFTLAADTRKGARPSFASAAAPEDGERLFDVFVNQLKRQTGRVACGRFGADMQVSLVNDGPVTFTLRSIPES